MRTGEPITLRQAAAVLKGEIAWMRIYPTDVRASHGEDCMGRDAMNEAVNRYGERTIRRMMPGYRFVIIWLDEE